MMAVNRFARWGFLSGAFWGCAGAVLLFAVPGCPTGGTADTTDGSTDGDGTSGGSQDGGAVSGQIVNVSSTSSISVSALEEALSIIYNATAPEGALISGFFEPADGGGRTTVASLLPTGTGQFAFDPTLAGVGTFRVGVIINSGGQETTVISGGVITVQGPPDPVFLFPSADMDSEAGQDITVRFDVGDPEGANVHWRAFYLSESDSRDLPPTELGTQLGAPGTGNVGQRLFSTTGLEAGAYQLGVSATDSGRSIATTYATNGERQIVTRLGPTIRLVEGLAARPPKIEVISPGSRAVELFADQSFTIVVEAAVNEPGAVGIVEVFYDLDNDFNLGFAGVIGTASISPSATPGTPETLTFQLPVGLAEDTYFIGASISDGFNPQVVDYAASTITIVREPALAVTTPDLSEPIPPADPSNASTGVRVEWSTNIPVSGGTVDVFARALDKTGQPIGAELPIEHSGSTAIKSAVFFPEQSGVYEVTVRIALSSPSVAPEECPSGLCIDSAPQPVRVSTLPRVLWAGSLADEEPPFDGAVFQGRSAEDNAGTSLGRAGDLDGDGLADFIIAARYGKSFLASPPPAVGPGEAYIIYGASGSARLTGVFDLGLVGTDRLPGVLVTGIRTVGDSSDTDGLSAVSLLPDVDGDMRGELAFGFPRTNSACTSSQRLCTNGQFLNGGVVMLSSTNGILADPLSGTPVIDSGAVGQTFSDTTRQSLELEDQFEFPEDDPEAEACIAGSDEIPDTILGPSEGFIAMLASPGTGGFTAIPEGTTVAPGVCVTRYNVGTCQDPGSGQAVLGGSVVGSGFYPETTSAREPFGARIIGPGQGAGFGASISVAAGSEDRIGGKVVITAPNRDALASEVEGLSADILGAGVVYSAANRNLWGEDVDPIFAGSSPTPHQYVMGIASHCGTGRAPPLDPVRLAGLTSNRIQNVLAIEDFNGDGRDDIAVGVPGAAENEDRVYILYRQDTGSDRQLGNIALAPTSPSRVDGVMIKSSSLAGFGASLATGVDFNGDGASDLVIGSPDANNRRGEVVIVFGDPGLESPADGLDLETLLLIRNDEGKPRGTRITGSTATTEQAWFGYNVANAGDVDGDGFNDLLIAAPNATPRFDGDPTDGVDEFSTVGVDLDFDGNRDDVTGPDGEPDGVVDANDELRNAGVVYLVFGGARLDLLPSIDGSVSITELGSQELQGLVIAGRAAGDRLGGGDAGEVAQGGNSTKNGRGRSRGLGSAGDVEGDGRSDVLIGAALSDPRSVSTGTVLTNGGEAYLLYSSSLAAAALR